MVQENMSQERKLKNIDETIIISLKKYSKTN